MRTNPIVRAWPALPILLLLVIPKFSECLRTEHAIASEGAIYQVFGILVVVFSLDEKLKHFRGISLLGSFVSWCRDFWNWLKSLWPWRKPKTQNLYGSTSGAGGSYGRTTMTLQIHQLPVQEQLDWLKSKVDELAVKIDTNDEKVQVQFKNMEAKINGIEASISVKISEFNKKLSQFMTGSFKWELVGTVSLLVGAVFGTVPWWVMEVYK
jgi:hypothetical protein